MKERKTMRIALLSLLAVAGCVGQGTYDALKATHAATLEQLQQTRDALTAEEIKAKAIAENMSKVKHELGTTQKDKSSLEVSVEQMREALSELKRRKSEADARIAEFKALLGKFKTLIDSG